MPLTGSCLCGDVAFEIDGPVEALAHCHCSMCRKAHGAAFASYVAAPKSAFRWLRGADRIRRYASSPSAWRPFCARCGSTVPAAPESMDRVFVPAGLLAEDPKVSPAQHFFVASKAPWYEIADSLPQFAEYPAGVGEAIHSPRKTEPTPEAVRGGCLCGAVAYEIPRPIAGPIVFCHCSRCRRARAAAHNANFFVDLTRFRWLRGAERVATYKVPEAERFTQAFCRDCGSPVAHVGQARVVVPAGSLDDDPGIRPGMHIFAGSKAPWFEIRDDLARYDEYPPAGPPALTPSPR
jgi:hypothetical protein